MSGYRSGTLAAVIALVVLCVGCGASKPEDAPRRPATAGTPALHNPPPGPAPAADSTGAPAAAATTGTAASVDTVAAVPVQDTAAALPASNVVINDALKIPMAAPVAFEVMAIAMRDTVRLKSTAASDAAGFACAPGAAGATSGALRTLPILRFAHTGVADSPFAMRWTLFFPEGEGVLEGRRLSASERPTSGEVYEVTLRGKLQFNLILRGATQPMRLTTTARNPEFKGYSKSWPPYGAVLKLSNGPIGFFHKDPKPNQRAAILVVHETMFSFGKRATKYMGEPPKIVKAEILDAAGKEWASGAVTGVRVEWKGVPVAPVELDGYNVYRADAGSDAWTRIAELPSSQTSYVDKEYDGRTGHRYAVVYRTRYTPDVEHQGTIGPNVTVAAVR